MPFYKRELSFRRKSATARGGQCGHAGPDEIESDRGAVQDETVDAFNDSELERRAAPAADGARPLDDAATPSRSQSRGGDAEDGDATVAAGDDDVARVGHLAERVSRGSARPRSPPAPLSIAADADPSPRSMIRTTRRLDAAADFTGAQDVDGLPERRDAADVEGALEVEDAADVDGALEVEAESLPDQVPMRLPRMSIATPPMEPAADRRCNEAARSGTPVEPAKRQRAAAPRAARSSD